MSALENLRAWVAKQPQSGVSGGGNHTGLDLLAKALEEVESRHFAETAASLDDAMGVFSKRQAEVERRRFASKTRSNAEVADMKAEIARCSWACHTLRAERGRRKKGKEKTG